MARPSPLYPKGGRRAGKAQYNWIPTTDLMSRWPVAVFTWALLLLDWFQWPLLTGIRVHFSPAPISKAHTVTQLSIVPAVATTPNSGSCTNCHSLTGQHGAAMCGVSHN